MADGNFQWKGAKHRTQSDEKRTNIVLWQFVKQLSEVVNMPLGTFVEFPG